MIRLVPAAIFLCALFLPGALQAFDWISLHEKADKTTYGQAQSEADAGPESPEKYYVLGLVCLTLHRDDEAGSAFERVRGLDPDGVEAQWGLAEVLRRGHRASESEEQLAAVLEKDPAFVPALVTLAYIRFTAMDFQTSAGIAEKVAGMGRAKMDTSNFVRAHLILAGSRGLLAHRSGPIAKVRYGLSVMKHIRAAEQIQPDSAGVYYGRGMFRLIAPAIAGGSLKKGEQDLIKAVEKDPLFADAYVRLAEVYRKKGDMAKYQENMDKALAIDPLNELAKDITSGKCDFICIK
jgi:tetratricopeptide (TPR) repeat protein